MSGQDEQSPLAAIAAQAMKALVQREYLVNARMAADSQQGKNTGNVPEGGLMTKHIDGDNLASDTYRLALRFNSLSDYEAALSKLKGEQAGFDDQAAETYSIIASLDDEDPEAAAMMDELMSTMLSPVNSLSRYDVLQRLACVYAVLLAEWEKVPHFGVSDIAHRVGQDAKFSDYLSQAFGVMSEAATLEQWNGIVSSVLSPADRNVMPTLKGLQP